MNPAMVKKTHPWRSSVIPFLRLTSIKSLERQTTKRNQIVDWTLIKYCTNFARCKISIYSNISLSNSITRIGQTTMSLMSMTNNWYVQQEPKEENERIKQRKTIESYFLKIYCHLHSIYIHFIFVWSSSLNIEWINRLKFELQENSLLRAHFVISIHAHKRWKTTKTNSTTSTRWGILRSVFVKSSTEPISTKPLNSHCKCQSVYSQLSCVQTHVRSKQCAED